MTSDATLLVGAHQAKPAARCSCGTPIRDASSATASTRPAVAQFVTFVPGTRTIASVGTGGELAFYDAMTISRSAGRSLCPAAPSRAVAFCPTGA